MAQVSVLSLFAPLTCRKCLFLTAVFSLFLTFVGIFRLLSWMSQMEKTCTLNNERFFSIGDGSRTGTFRKTCYYLANSSKSVTYRYLSDVRSFNDTVPRILHRTWNDDVGLVPEKWLETYTGLDGGGDCYLCAWTHAEMKEFIAAEYSLFHPVFVNYQHSAQRTAAARYFIIYHFGGIYHDIDLQFDVRIDRLLYGFPNFDVILTLLDDGFADDLLVSKPRKAFWRHVIDNLDDSTKWYGLPLTTASYSTGSVHLEKCYSSYTAAGARLARVSAGRIAVVPIASLRSQLSNSDLEPSLRSILAVFIFFNSIVFTMVFAVMLLQCWKFRK